MGLIYYGPSTGGFYLEAVHGRNIPADALEISHDERAELLRGREQGKVIELGGNGRPELRDPPPPTEQQLIEQFTREVQDKLDSTARAYGYDSIGNAVTYAEEPAVPKFQSEGRAFRAWRSACWAYCYSQLDAVQNGQRAMPTPQDLVAELPALEMANG